MIRTISHTKVDGGGLDLWVREDGVIGLRLWTQDSHGILVSAPPIYLDDEELGRLFDDIGGYLIEPDLDRELVSLAADLGFENQPTPCSNYRADEPDGYCVCGSGPHAH